MMKQQTKIFTPYYRVSTAKQGKSGLGLEAQKNAAMQHIGGDSSRLKGEFLEVETGKKNQRTELTKAIDFCKQHGTTLLIAKLDRLSRNAAFIFKLRDEKVDFVCCDLPDANTLTIGIFATLAQHERELISKRTSDALQALKARGVKLGSPQNLTAAARAKGHAAIRKKARENKNNRRAVGYIKHLRDNGATYQSIADTLNREGFRTAREKLFDHVAVMRLYKNASKFAETVNQQYLPKTK